MSRMLRNSRNDRSTYTDTCGCRECRNRGGVDDMVRRAQRARERDEFRRQVSEETA
jgi:hypothetical protein